MTEPISTTARVERALSRWNAGDAAAKEELIEHGMRRCRALARRMLRFYPKLRPLAQTDDVQQEAMIRLWNALAKVTPKDARHFFSLASQHIRWVLMEHARKLNRRAAENGIDPARLLEQPANSTGAVELQIWSEFHEKAGVLPPNMREAFDLIYYQGMQRKEAADVLGVKLRTVYDYWLDARLWLYEAMGNGPLPGL